MSAKQVGTDRQIAALRPAEKPYECSIDGSRGLRVRVFPAGTKQFEFRYTATNGARRRHLLGAYPDVSLSAARDKAATLRVSVTDGADPAAERAAERERARTGETLSELAEAYWKAAVVGLHGGRKRPKRVSTIAKEHRWWRHIEPRLGPKRFAEIRRADIKTFMRDLATESGLSPASIADISALLQAVLGFAVQEDRLDANPAVGLARSRRETACSTTRRLASSSAPRSRLPLSVGKGGFAKTSWRAWARQSASPSACSCSPSRAAMKSRAPAGRNSTLRRSSGRFRARAPRPSICMWCR